MIENNTDHKVPSGSTRSTHWSVVREAHLKLASACAVCGALEDLEVHHILPFHIHPEDELNPDNLITLCETSHGGAHCHLLFGHLGNFRSFNKDVVADASEWRNKISTRPSTVKVPLCNT